MKRLITLTGASLSTLLFAAAPAASAAGVGATCDLSSDCDAGLSCEVVGGSSCACPEGGNCEPCETTVERACVPGPCQSDADCGDDLVCVSYDAPCAGTARPCEPGTDCDAEPPPECEPETRSVCAPRWVLPCEESADCGGGFTCEAIEECACTGGSSTDPDSGGGSDGSSGDEGSGDAFAPPPDDESDCTCTPSEDKYCHPTEVSCESDAQCPEGWSCLMETTAIACVDREGGSMDCPDAAPPATSGTCAPDGWSGGDTRSEDDFALPGTAESVDKDTSPTDPLVNDGVGATAASGGGCAGGGDVLGFAGLLMALALVARRRVAYRTR